MANPFRVEVVSVESLVWAGEADQVVARTTEGELAVLPGHEPMLGQLKEPSRVRVMAASGEVAFDVTGGFISVAHDLVAILAEGATPAHGEDPARALISTGPETH